jgi:beta-xylosidase
VIGLRARPLRTASSLALAALATLGAFSAGFGEVSAEPSPTPPTHDSPAALGPTGTPVPLADPFVLASGARYFAFGSNSPTANIPTFTSTDLTDWSAGPDALPKLASWATDYGIFRLTWAPSVIGTGSGFTMYYATADAANVLHCISSAHASSPLGPYVDDSTGPLVCQTLLGGDIDPSVFTDHNGTRYLLWKSDGNCCAKHTLLWSQELSPDGAALIGDPSPLLSDGWTYQGGIVEAPSMISERSVYYLFFSVNAWATSNYSISYAVCSSPLGPCAQPLDHPFYASHGAMSGPGGPEFFTTSYGQRDMSYAAWTGMPRTRTLRLVAVRFKHGLPYTHGPDLAAAISASPAGHQ